MSAAAVPCPSSKMARALRLNVPAGPTKFTYFGGDLRFSRERVSSDALRLKADDLEGTATGSVGFDRTLNYVGTGTLKTLPSGTAPAALRVKACLAFR